MQKCLKLKEDGNALLKSKRFSEAISLYKASLDYFEQLIDQDQIQTEDEMFRMVSQVKIPCMKNISLCLLKLNKFDECVQKCDEILRLQPECPKTNYRKAAAMLDQNRIDEAQAILKDCFFKYPNQKQFQVELEDIEARKQKIRERQQAKTRSQTEWSRFMLRWLLFLLIPVITLWKILFKNQPPFYGRVHDWANGKTLRLL